MLLVLLVRLEHGGAWLITLGPEGGQPASGRLTATEGERLIEQIEELLRPPVVVVRGRVAGVEHAEDEVGRRLASIFRPSTLTRMVGELRGRIRAQGQRLCLVVDVEDDRLARIPWELIALGEDLPRLEAEGGLVVRLCRGPAEIVAAPAAGLRALLWCPTPEDPACRVALAGVTAALEARGLPWLPAPGELPTLPPPQPDTLDVLVLICHGDYAAEGPLLALSSGDCAPGTVASALVDGMPQLATVLIGVCGGGVPTWAQLKDLAGRLLLAGAPSVVAPRASVGAEALVAFTSAWLPALAEQGLVGATRAGRQAVLGLLTPHPDSRPWAFPLQIGNVHQLGGGPWAPRRWRPRELGAAGRDLLDLLGRAAATAEGLGSCWVGLEHLLVCWRPDEGGLLSTRLRGLLVEWDAALIDRLRAGLERRGELPAELVPSPRLRALASALPPGGDLDEFCRLLLDDPAHVLHNLAWRSLGALRLLSGVEQESLGSVSLLEDEPRPATRLQVIWGPEDGRTLSPTPGQTIGRNASVNGPDLALYIEGPFGDPNVHRRHLRYDGPGAFTLLHSASVVRRNGSWRRPEPARGPLRLMSGDLVLLTPSTWLRALP